MIEKETKRILRQVFSAGAAFVLLLAPSIAMAQWDLGLERAEDSGLPGGTIIDIIGTTVGWLLSVFGILALIGFFISGILYITAAGDERRMEQGKNAMVYCIMGVIAALIGYVVIKAVDLWLEGAPDARI